MNRRDVLGMICGAVASPLIPASAPLPTQPVLPKCEMTTVYGYKKGDFVRLSTADGGYTYLCTAEIEGLV